MNLAPYRRAFEELGAQLPAVERASRAAHFDSFAVKGFPHKKLEDWRYTDLSALNDKVYALPRSRSCDLSRLTLAGTHPAFFINGLNEHPLPPSRGKDGMGEEPVASAATPTPSLPREGGGSVVALNAALTSSGFVLNLSSGEIAENPFHVLTWCEDENPAQAHLRHRITLGENARATVILQHGGRGDYLTTQVTDISLAPGSRLTLVRIQDESVHSHHLAQTDALLARDSRLDVVSIDLGAGLARHDLNVVLGEAGAETHLHGLFAPAHGAHIDNHTRIEHRAPHCISREFFRGVVNEDTRAVFNGKIYVAEGARKTDSEQRIASLLLSPKAEINAKPELEIYNDDVKCAHGATFGQLDEDAIYYLRARGVDREAARALLTYSFAREIIDAIEHETLRQRVTARLLEHLPQSQLLGSLL